MRAIWVSGSDEYMDCRCMNVEPINQLDRKCQDCGFPDIENPPRPYRLVRSRTMSPNELAEAYTGNMFVRERVRRILELVVPGECTYMPTVFQGTSDETPWILAVATHQMPTAIVSPAVPRCPTCGEPRYAHPGSHWVERTLPWTASGTSPRAGMYTSAEFDIVQSSTWGSAENGWERLIHRDRYMSVRLFNLLKKLKVKGFHPVGGDEPVRPNKEEVAWIKEKLELVEANGIPLYPAGTLSDEDAAWYRRFLKDHARSEQLEWDRKAEEKRLKVKLPKSYVDFITSVGPMSFDDVDEQEGFTASILPPADLRFEGHSNQFDDEESRGVNGLMFASTGHGDCFYFDARKGTKEYAVFLYQHEMNCLEPYAENFVACIRRFAGDSDGG